MAAFTQSSTFMLCWLALKPTMSEGFLLPRYSRSKRSKHRATTVCRKAAWPENGNTMATTLHFIGAGQKACSICILMQCNRTMWSCSLQKIRLSVLCVCDLCCKIGCTLDFFAFRSFRCFSNFFVMHLWQWSEVPHQKTQYLWGLRFSSAERNQESSKKQQMVSKIIKCNHSEH